MRTNRSFSLRFLYLLAVLLPLPVVLAVGALQDSELNAQEVQLRPLAGLYLPSRMSVQQGSLYARQKIGVTVGARLTLTFNKRLDLVTAVTYLPGYVMFRGAGKRIDLGTGSHLLTATTAGRYWLLPLAGRFSWELHTGLGVGFGGLPAYEDLFVSSTLTGILGTAVRYQIGRMVSLHLRIQDRLYRVRFGSGDPGSSKPPLQISFGLDLPFVESAP
jgi:hypothetical protein